jgi:hypothetical protein
MLQIQSSLHRLPSHHKLTAKVGMTVLIAVLGSSIIFTAEAPTVVKEVAILNVSLTSR